MTFILIGFLVFFTVLLFWQFLGYPLLMAIISIRHKSRLPAKDYAYQPFISIIVPAYNEENVIRQRIENLLSQDYPEDSFEVIVVVSGSADSTAEIAGEFENENANVKVFIEEKRQGKASAINLGKSHARGEIVMVTDANTVFGANVLREIAPHFQNPETGAVGGRFVLSNVENELLRASSFYWEIESLMRRGESVLNSACLFHGEINAWRKDIIEADTGSLAEDLDMAISISRRGLKIVYEPAAVANEAGPTTRKEQIIQKKRATIGTIQSLFRHKKYLWLPANRYSGIIFPSHKTLQVLSPFLLLGLLAMLTALIASGEFITFMAYIIAVVILFAFLLSLLYRSLRSVIDIGDSSAGTVLQFNFPGVLSYVLLHEYIILLAWKDFITGNYSVVWQKAESTR